MLRSSAGSLKKGDRCLIFLFLRDLESRTAMGAFRFRILYRCGGIWFLFFVFRDSLESGAAMGAFRFRILYRFFDRTVRGEVSLASVALG